LQVITHGEVDKLQSIRAPEESVLSLYLEVPLDPAGLRELPGRAGDLIKAAAGGGPGLANAEDEQVARTAVAAHSREWLGHTLAVFVCGDLGLLEVVPLPGRLAERAVLAVRPHVRPLLAALQRHPDHRIVIINGRHVWLLAVAGDRIDTVARASSGRVSSAAFGGWYGLEPYGVNQRVAELTRHHYRDAVAILEQAVLYGGPQPLVIGGHVGAVKDLLADLPREVRDGYAGCFAADPHTLTPARARDLAAPVIAHCAEQRERQLVQEIMAAPGVLAAIGLPACLAAVNADAAELLLIPDDAMVPGYHCERCDVLSLTSDGCCDWGAASRALPDLLEEMALRTLHDGGDVISARELPCGAAARVR
jgi:Bacterial archaeo-eukaryotic release factor family 10